MPLVDEPAPSNPQEKCELLEVNGRRYPLTLNENIVKNMPGLKVRDDDVMICGYMRAGTHWMFEILNMVLTGHVETVPNDKESLQLEQVTQEMIDTFPSPRVLNAHLLFEELPRDVTERKTKIVYLVRDPRDSLASWYTCLNTVFVSLKPNWHVSFPDWLELSNKGKLEWGSWFDHIKSWEKTMQEHQEYPIHIVYYEELLQDPVCEIMKIKNFLEVDRDALFCKRVADKTKFEKMVREKDEYTDKYGGKIVHYHKGIVGNWKTMFTVSMSEEFDQLYERRMSESRFKHRYSRSATRYC